MMNCGGDKWSYKTCKRSSQIITTNIPSPKHFTVALWANSQKGLQQLMVYLNNVTRQFGMN